MKLLTYFPEVIGNKTILRLATPGQHVVYLDTSSGFSIWREVLIVEMNKKSIAKDPTWYNVEDVNSEERGSIELTVEQYHEGWKYSRVDVSTLNNEQGLEVERRQDEYDSIVPSHDNSQDKDNDVPPNTENNSSTTDDESPELLPNSPSWDPYNDEPSYFGLQPLYFTPNPDSGPGFVTPSLLPHQNLLPPPLNRPIQTNRVYDMSQTLPIPSTPPRTRRPPARSPTEPHDGKFSSKVKRWFKK